MSSDKTWGFPSEPPKPLVSNSWSAPSFSFGVSPTINNAGSCSAPSSLFGFSPTINNAGSWSRSAPSFSPTTSINNAGIDGSSGCSFFLEKPTIPHERVSMNGLMSKSPAKEEEKEAKGADSQHENRVPDEMKHTTVKRETIKNSPLPMILISRILKGIPQSPHFLELRRYSVTSRAHLEGAWDRTFEETLEQIHGLRASGFWVGAREIWKTMEELEGLGYNVFVLRKRVVELTDLMVKRNKRQSEIIVLKVRAEVHRMEKSRLESVIRNLRAEAQSEQDKMVENLIGAADKEKDLPQLENELANLAIEPLQV